MSIGVNPNTIPKRSTKLGLIPTLNPELKETGQAVRRATPNGHTVIDVSLENDVKECFCPNTKAIHANYPDGRRLDLFNNGERRTFIPGELLKKEYYQKNSINYCYPRGKQDVVYRVYDYKDAIGVIYKTKETQISKFYNKSNGEVSVHENEKRLRKIRPTENSFRKFLPDGTQIKEVKLDGLEEKFRITKKLGPQTKTAEVITADGQIKSLFRKSYKTGQREIHPDLSRYLPKDLKTKILSPKQKFLKVAKDLIKWLKQDGTQVKEVKLDGLEEKLRITKKLEPQTKIAEVIMADGQVKSLFRKSYKTGQREIHPDLSKLLSQEAREDILSQKQKFSETAKKLIKWLKEYKLLK